MVDIEVINNGEDYNTIHVRFGEDELEISFERNLDLYWSYVPKRKIYEEEDVKTFVTTAEDVDFYPLIRDLYKAISTDRPFYNYTGKDIYTERNKKVPKWNSAAERQLFDGKRITWRSDGYLYENASILTIEKQDDKYIISFQKSKQEEDHFFIQSFFVRISNSGSRYDPFNITFMNMYNTLIRREKGIARKLDNKC